VAARDDVAAHRAGGAHPGGRRRRRYSVRARHALRALPVARAAPARGRAQRRRRHHAAGAVDDRGGRRHPARVVHVHDAAGEGGDDRPAEDGGAPPAAERVVRGLALRPRHRAAALRAVGLARERVRPRRDRRCRQRPRPRGGLVVGEPAPAPDRVRRELRAHHARGSRDLRGVFPVAMSLPPIVMLIPMYFVIGVWGGANRVYAAVKFVLYTMVGSALMLVAILALYYQHGAATGTYTFDLPTLTRFVLAPGRAQTLMFLAFALAFAIKVPLFPLHTWLPDAHVEAPTAGSVILAGVLLKMGTYGFLRFCLPLFPDASVDYAPWIFALAVVGIVYGAWVSTVQPDIKKLVAYSSVSHLGFVMLGIFTLTPQGLVGGIIQMINHGLSTGALFLMVGMIYERRHTRLIADFGGLWRVVPAFSALFLVTVLSSVGLPGLNGFVGEFLILVGAFQVNRVLAAVATTGIIFAAVYLLWAYQRVIF